MHCAAFFASHWSEPARCWCWETSEWTMAVVYRKKLANQCSMPIFFIESLVCCNWKFYNLVAWWPGKFLRVRCSLPARRVFWKIFVFDETVWIVCLFNCLTLKRHDTAFDGLPLHPTVGPLGPSHKRSDLRSFRRASLQAADAFPGTSPPWLSESLSGTGRSARWRCQLADVGGTVRSLVPKEVLLLPVPLETADLAAVAVARQVCEWKVNKFHNFWVNGGKNGFAL